MIKILKTILSTLTFPLRFLKRTKVDNFLAGAVFGAIFSLIVNVTTFKLQESVNKQRSLEALEREIVFHALLANDLVREENRTYESNDEEYLYVDNVMARRYSTRIWESNGTSAYFFELNPHIAAKIETYYSHIVMPLNRMLDDNENLYNTVYSNCDPIRELTPGLKRENKSICNEIARNSISLNATLTKIIYENVDDIHREFHPAQDRLNSWWLKLLLGDEAYEVVKL